MQITSTNILHEQITNYKYTSYTFLRILVITYTNYKYKYITRTNYKLQIHKLYISSNSSYYIYKLQIQVQIYYT